MPLFEATKKEVDKLYTHKIQIPQYIPSNDVPAIEGLVDYEKYSRLIRNINNSNVSNEEKQFLRFAASRHLEFNYSLIADYYAHAEPEMQRLMEESALVILDIDDAIANGYMKLSENIKQILKESGESVKDKE